ncbi:MULTISPECIES: zinc-dependent metalloprotease [unclassified Leucobacter]|uniref:zinc-dependent metalloprotease n=1 Tax=unclassified Leucobacter TaxID=2621730 RepID=UPI000622A18F|nr:zinc-dependent metalloprotease [Leucobacter sp. Ag1]KKI19228.1 hypothetical protein XM48_09850 [Leucobacter sp. Ag1]
MSTDSHDGEGRGPEDEQNTPDDQNDLQRMLREFLSGNGPAGGIDPSAFASAAGLPIDQQALQGLMNTLQNAMRQPSDGIDWSVTRRTAIDVAAEGGEGGDRAQVERAFPVAGLWLDEVTEVGAAPDAPRAITRIEWVQATIDTWVGFAEPVAESITRALMEALTSQLPEELGESLAGAGPMLRSVGGALFATQLGTVVGKLSREISAGGDIGIPLLTGPGREGGALLPSGVAAFAEGLDQDAEAVTLYLAVRELAHARLFRHARWLRQHLLSAITDYARGIRIDTDRIEELASELDIERPEQVQEMLAGGALIPPKTAEQEAAHARLENTLALIEGWVDAVTADAVSRLPGADAIAEMVRRRRATGGPAEHAFGTLVGLELRPRRMREAAAVWRLVAERGGISARDGLWAHPDLLPTAEELDHPARLLERIGLAGDPEPEADEFDRELQKLLAGGLEGLDGPASPANDSDGDANPDEEPRPPAV